MNLSPQKNWRNPLQEHMCMLVDQNLDELYYRNVISFKITHIVACDLDLKKL